MRRIALALLLAGCGDNKSPPSIGFTKHVIDPAFRAEGVTTFDVDADGVRDIVTRELWWRGPSYTQSFELRAPMAFDVTTQYAASFHATHFDVDGDGYEDLISWGGPGQASEWCRNPQGHDEHWTCVEINSNNPGETPGRLAVFAGQPASIVSGIGVDAERRLAVYAPSGGGSEWTFQTVSPLDFEPAQHHGLGAVDINSDTRVDLVTGAGWLEQPVVANDEWIWHPTEISPNNISHIWGHDFNLDGRVDLIGASPHNRGVWWLEQGGPVDAPTFTKHLIDEEISQTHASVLYDMDRDGSPDLVTGKRWYAHFGGDPGIDEPVVLVIYRYMRGADGTLTWTKFEVDNDSGVGNEFDVVDLNLDGKPDIVAATRKGVFWFEQN